MDEKLKILVVCGRNKRRSKTAESIFRKEPNFKIQSAGLSPKSPSHISKSKINWSDAIMVMEDGHKARILGQYRHLILPPIYVLHVEDEFEYMQAELIEILEERILNTIKYEIKIKNLNIEVYQH
jgi:protein-tyrosine phosphatase